VSQPVLRPNHPHLQHQLDQSAQPKRLKFVARHDTELNAVRLVVPRMAHCGALWSSHRYFAWHASHAMSRSMDSSSLITVTCVHDRGPLSVKRAPVCRLLLAFVGASQVPTPSNIILVDNPSLIQNIPSLFDCNLFPSQPVLVHSGNHCARFPVAPSFYACATFLIGQCRVYLARSRSFPSSSAACLSF
jgi:hypothetical protein